MRSFGRTAAAATAAGALLLPIALTALPAQAGVSQQGKVTFVGDGDTIDVDIAGDGRGPVRIRLVGIQAMELREYHQDPTTVRGECHGPSATRRLHDLVYGQTVRLTARHAGSTNRGRPARFVAVRDSDGMWQDVGAILMAEGYVMPSFHRTEYARNAQYRSLAQQAAAAHRHLWKPDACGSGPAQSATIRASVKWDADGDDGRNVNGEWIRITSSRSVSLAGWWVRDSATRNGNKRGYTLPKGAMVTASRPVYVHVGKGRAHTTSKARHYYMGQPDPIFENVTRKPTSMGDGGYLFDPDGDLRAGKQYPCAYRC